MVLTSQVPISLLSRMYPIVPGTSLITPSCFSPMWHSMFHVLFCIPATLRPFPLYCTGSSLGPMLLSRIPVSRPIIVFSLEGLDFLLFTYLMLSSPLNPDCFSVYHSHAVRLELYLFIVLLLSMALLSSSQPRLLIVWTILIVLLTLIVLATYGHVLA